MRCATCGTENAPDSRFCGGCGAKLAPASRLATTAKIPDDASYPSQPPQNASIPPQGNYASGPASIPPQNHAHGPASIPPQNNAPKSIPPQNAYPAAQAPGSIPPTNNPVSQNSFQRAATPMADASRMPTPPPGSLSFAAAQREPEPTSQRPPISTPPPDASFVSPPRRPVGLMVFVLLVDLALAGSGAVLLGKGLSAKKAAPKPVQKTQRAPRNDVQSDVPSTNVEARASNIETSSGTNIAAPSPSAPVSPSVPTGSSVSAGAPQVATKGAPQAATTESAKSSSSQAATSSSPQAATSSSPQAKPASNNAAGPQAAAPVSARQATPPPPAPAPSPPAPAAQPTAPEQLAEVSFDTQLDRQTAASKPAFDRCAADAGAPRGAVRIAFRVLEDGSVANAFPVEDSTGSPTLGQCLAQTITTWRFSPHAGAPINSLRAFNYP